VCLLFLQGHPETDRFFEIQEFNFHDPTALSLVLALSIHKQ